MSTRSTTVNRPIVANQNSKWDCIRRDERICTNNNNNCNRLSQRVELTNSQVLDASQRKYVDLIKYTIVSVALVSVMLGGGYLAWHSGDVPEKLLGTLVQPVQHYEENSYLGGWLTIVRMNTTNALGEDSRKVMVELPHFMDTVMVRLEEVIDLCSYYMSFFNDDDLIPVSNEQPDAVD